MPDLQQKLERCFQAVFPDLKPEAVRTAQAASMEAWDSTALVTLMTVVEEEFAVIVDPEDLERWTSFETIRNYLAGKTDSSS